MSVFNLHDSSWELSLSYSFCIQIVSIIQKHIKFPICMVEKITWLISCCRKGKKLTFWIWDWDFCMNTVPVWMLSPLQICMLNSCPQYDGISRWSFSRWVNHKGKALMNEINTLIQQPERAPCPFCHGRIQGEVCNLGEGLYWMNCGIDLSLGQRRILSFIR